MVSFQLAQIVFVAGLSTITTAAAFLGWWFWDQRRTWVVEINPGEGDSEWTKKTVGKNYVRGSVNGNDYKARLEPAKTYYKKGWRSGRLVFIDVSNGVQVDPCSDAEKPVGYDMAKVVDAELAEAWKGGYVDENPFMRFLNQYGTTVGMVVLGLTVVLVYANMRGGF